MGSNWQINKTLKIHLDLPQVWIRYSEILDNIVTVVKHFKRLLNMHKSDTFNGKMSYILALSCLCYRRNINLNFWVVHEFIASRCAKLAFYLNLLYLPKLCNAAIIYRKV